MRHEYEISELGERPKPNLRGLDSSCVILKRERQSYAKYILRPTNVYSKMTHTPVYSLLTSVKKMRS